MWKMKRVSFCNEIFKYKFLEVFWSFFLLVSSCQNQTLVNIFPKLVNSFFFFFAVIGFLLLKNILIDSTSILSFRFLRISISILNFLEAIRVKTDFVGLFKILSVEYFIWIADFCHLLQSVHMLIKLNGLDSSCNFIILYLSIILSSNTLINNKLFFRCFLSKFVVPFLELLPCYFYFDCSLNRTTLFISTLTKDAFRFISSLMSCSRCHNFRRLKYFIFGSWLNSEMFVFPKVRKSASIFLISLLGSHNKMKTSLLKLSPFPL